MWYAQVKVQVADPLLHIIFCTKYDRKKLDTLVKEANRQGPESEQSAQKYRSYLEPFYKLRTSVCLNSIQRKDVITKYGRGLLCSVEPDDAMLRTWLHHFRFLRFEDESTLMDSLSALKADSYSCKAQEVQNYNLDDCMRFLLSSEMPEEPLRNNSRLSLSFERSSSISSQSTPTSVDFDSLVTTLDNSVASLAGEELSDFKRVRAEGDDSRVEFTSDEIQNLNTALDSSDTDQSAISSGTIKVLNVERPSAVSSGFDSTISYEDSLQSKHLRLINDVWWQLSFMTDEEYDSGDPMYDDNYRHHVRAINTQSERISYTTAGRLLCRVTSGQLLEVALRSNAILKPLDTDFRISAQRNLSKRMVGMLASIVASVVKDICYAIKQCIRNASLEASSCHNFVILGAKRPERRNGYLFRVGDYEGWTVTVDSYDWLLESQGDDSLVELMGVIGNHLLSSSEIRCELIYYLASERNLLILGED